MRTPCGSCETDVSEKHIPSSFRVKDFESAWFVARTYLTMDGEEILFQPHNALCLILVLLFGVVCALGVYVTCVLCTRYVYSCVVLS
jgi:hypothetical protein